MSAEKEFIFTKEKSGVGIAMLNRPERLNALSPGISQGLSDLSAELRADPEVKVVILTGAGRAFCSGADVSTLPGGSQQGDAARQSRGWRRPHTELGWGWMMRFWDQPVIGAINGYAVGAGLGLALNTDLRVAGDDARFGALQVRRGITADAGLVYLMPRLVGVEKAMELMLTGDMVDAQEALRIGLVTRVAPPGKLMDVAMELAERLAKGPSLAISVMKRAIYHAETSDFLTSAEYISWAQDRLFMTEDSREGARAFMERREPEFKGR